MMPTSALIKIAKYIDTERDRGFDNKTIIGGLDKVVAIWSSEARLEHVPEDQISLVSECFTKYPSMATKERESSLDRIWESLNLAETISHAQNASPFSPATRKYPENDANASPTYDKATLKARTHFNQEHSRTIPPSGEDTRYGLEAPLTILPGIGPAKAKSLQLLGIKTLGDLLYYFPRRYDDYSQLKVIRDIAFGENVTVIASIQDVTSHPTRNRALQITEAVVSDGTIPLRLTWFNQPWISRRLHKGKTISISGRVEQFLGRPVINNPDFEELDAEQLHTNRIVPIYPLTSQITQRWLRNTIFQTVRYWAPRIQDFLPPDLLVRNQLVDLPTALYQIHFPDKSQSIRLARERLAFDEIFLLQLGVLKQKSAWNALLSHSYEISDDALNAMLDALPYQLTNAQKKVLLEIRNDLKEDRPMNRLLQGDVGAGKTVLAALGAAIVITHQAQVAIMAPTSILASQHYQTITKLIETDPAFPFRFADVKLLIGDTSTGEKEQIRQGLENGSIKLVIGTHALLESPVVFKNLQLLIVDEQHRFGVAQRSLLRAKGDNPHLLVMTATPIPRSLALTIYGDLDLSVLDEMPPGREAVETHLLSPRERERAYSMIRAQINEGNQAFIIYPLVEGTDNGDTKAATEEHERLQKTVFPDLRLGLLHGRLKPEEKETIMQGFRAGEYHILVSTSVVEVGVDIPNATIMLVEGANRFGLAQLHQFRGRVGRGLKQSFCLLIPETDDSLENERLTAMTQSNDGFILAEKDLEQRGPGDFLGTRQSGFAELRLASLTDLHLIEKARNEAQMVFSNDPDLSDITNVILSSTFNRFWKQGQGDIS